MARHFDSRAQQELENEHMRAKNLLVCGHFRHAADVFEAKLRGLANYKISPRYWFPLICDLSDVYFHLGLWESAKILLRKSERYYSSVGEPQDAGRFYTTQNCRIRVATIMFREAREKDKSADEREILEQEIEKHVDAVIEDYDRTVIPALNNEYYMEARRLKYTMEHVGINDFRMAEVSLMMFHKLVEESYGVYSSGYQESIRDLGWVLERLRKFEAAEREYRKKLAQFVNMKQHPEYANACLMLAEFFQRRGYHPDRLEMSIPDLLRPYTDMANRESTFGKDHKFALKAKYALADAIYKESKRSNRHLIDLDGARKMLSEVMAKTKNPVLQNQAETVLRCINQEWSFELGWPTLRANPPETEIRQNALQPPENNLQPPEATESNEEMGLGPLGEEINVDEAMNLDETTDFDFDELTGFTQAADSGKNFELGQDLDFGDESTSAEQSTSANTSS